MAIWSSSRDIWGITSPFRHILHYFFPFSFFSFFFFFLFLIILRIWWKRSLIKQRSHYWNHEHNHVTRNLTVQSGSSSWIFIEEREREKPHRTNHPWTSCKNKWIQQTLTHKEDSKNKKAGNGGGGGFYLDDKRKKEEKEDLGVKKKRKRCIESLFWKSHKLLTHLGPEQRPGQQDLR